jgi:ADP-heptose:LPS heptosyltransferase
MKQVVVARAFGDFMVALTTASGSKNIEAFKLYASEHHLPLYEAIPSEYKNPLLQLEFVNWGIKSSMLGIYTNKRLLLPNSLRELRQLKQWLNQQELTTEWILEQNLRKNIIQAVTGKKFNHIASGQNIYQQYHSFFESPPQQIILEEATIKKVLILPSARLAFRNIPPAIVQQIKLKHEQMGQNVEIASFGNTAHGLQEASSITKQYQNFTQLIKLILAADFIYTPDSLPAHLAYFFGKPHAILHPTSVSPAFFTPFALKHKTHYSFAEFQWS